METNVKTKWKVDLNHSEILFRVKHLMITNVKGEFRKFDATVESSESDFTDAQVNMSIDSASVFTNNDDRDKHLRSADFFDAEKYPHITFESTEFNKVDEDEYEMKGFLTIKGISKEVKLDVEFGGTNVDPYGNRKAGFSIKGRFNRKDWDLNWNAALETGGVLVSDEVKLDAEMQFIKV